MNEHIDLKDWAVITTTASRKTLGRPVVTRDRFLEDMSQGKVLEIEDAFEFSADFTLGQDAQGQQVLQRLPMTTTRDFLTDTVARVYVIAQEVYFLEDVSAVDKEKYTMFIRSAQQMAMRHRLAASGLVAPGQKNGNVVKTGG